MGLDQKITLRKVYYGPRNSTKADVDTYEYWFRKVNSLQGYMEEKYQTKNTEEHEINWDDIEYLHSVSSYILENNKDVEYMKENPPTQEGFFYGSTEYDEWYLEDMKHLNEVTTELLSMKDDSAHLTYWCWW